jgi:hypothetical protein
VAELGRWCGKCGTELRSGARFCSKCGQRIIEETPLADAPGPGREETGPGQPSGSGFTEVAVEPAAPVAGPGSTEVGAQLAVPVPGPDSPPRNEWSDWYASTEARGPFEAPVSGPATNRPPSSPPPAYQPQGYQPPGYQPQPYQPPVHPLPRPPRGPSGGDRPSRAPLFWSAIVAVAAIAVVVVLALIHSPNRHETINEAAGSATTARPTIPAAAGSLAASSSSSPHSSATASASTSAAVSSTGVTARQAASTVAGMLASSVTDRTAIDNAYNDVDGCGPNLAGDAAVFTSAASSRRTLLASLATMPGRSALPPALLGDLTMAWQASIAADQGFATWANDEVRQGCVADDTSDPGYRAASTPDSEATEYKADFVAEWNPIAARYGLTAYQQSQL